MIRRKVRREFMIFEDFDQLLRTIRKQKERKYCAVIGAGSEHALEAVKIAQEMGAVTAVLFGKKEVIKDKVQKLGMVVGDENICDCADPETAVKEAVKCAVKGEVDFLIKGQIETKTMMSQLVKKENGFRGSGVAHSVMFAEIETYEKILVATDAAILVDPTLEQKKIMIENTVAAMRKIGWEEPKVAVLSAVEKVNPKIRATVEARELQELCERGEIKDCIVEGPLAFDLAISKEAAALKGFESKVAGEVDLLIYPDLNAGNIASKVLTMTGHNRTGSVIIGLKTPIVMSSRGSTMENKLRGILLATGMI